MFILFCTSLKLYVQDYSHRIHDSMRSIQFSKVCLLIVTVIKNKIKMTTLLLTHPFKIAMKKKLLHFYIKYTNE